MICDDRLAVQSGEDERGVIPMDVGVIKLLVAAIGGMACISIGGWLCIHDVAGASSGAIEMRGVKFRWRLTGPGLGLAAIGAALMYAAIERPMTNTTTVTANYPVAAVSGGPSSLSTRTQMIERRMEHARPRYSAAEPRSLR